MNEKLYSSHCIIRGVGRLVVNHIIRHFQEGSWKYDVDLTYEKAKVGWFDTTVDVKFKWSGTKRDVELFTLAAKDYLQRVQQL